MEKKAIRDTVRAARIKRTAEIVGVSERYVQLVLNGDRQNDDVLLVYMEMAEGENKLIQEVKKLVPLN